jgi:hypothetical protein
VRLDLAQEHGGGGVGASGLDCSRGWRTVLCSERGADRFQADPVAGTLVAQDWPPAAGAEEAAAWCAANRVGAGAGDDEYARASREGCIEGDLLVAAKKERPPPASPATVRVAQSRTAGLDRPARPKQMLASETLAVAATSRSTAVRQTVASSSETRMSLTVPVEARARTRSLSASRQRVLVPPASIAR